jgi:hypothetical protein
MTYQYSPIKSIGDRSYAPLIITTGFPAEPIAEAKYIFLKDYSETYAAKWDLTRDPGALNPNWSYGGTERKINMSFTLGARNVAESKHNLAYCAKLIKKTYLNYLEEGTRIVGTGAGQVEIPNLFGVNPDVLSVNFGNLIQDTDVYLTKFNFEADFEAGFFTYDGTPIRRRLGSGGAGEVQDAYWNMDGNTNALISEQGYVFHGKKGKVYPRSINVQIEMHAILGSSVTDEPASPLGFGGKSRGGSTVSKGWSLNNDRDWPHGTGPIDAAKYCKSNIVAPSGPNDDSDESDNVGERSRSLRSSIGR